MALVVVFGCAHPRFEEVDVVVKGDAGAFVGDWYHYEGRRDLRITLEGEGTFRATVLVPVGEAWDLERLVVEGDRLWLEGEYHSEENALRLARGEAAGFPEFEMMLVGNSYLLARDPSRAWVGRAKLQTSVDNGIEEAGNLLEALVRAL